jgi:general secretion pathway protein I
MNNPQTKPVPRNDKGFTLIETLVSFAIVTLVLTLIYQILASSSQQTKLISQYSEATQLAESVLSQAKAYKYPRGDGKSGEYSWEYVLTKSSYEDLGSQLSLVDSMQLYDISVSVSWLSQRKERVVTLLSSTVIVNAN